MKRLKASRLSHLAHGEVFPSAATSIEQRSAARNPTDQVAQVVINEAADYLDIVRRLENLLRSFRMGVRADVCIDAGVRLCFEHYEGHWRLTVRDACAVRALVIETNRRQKLALEHAEALMDALFKEAQTQLDRVVEAVAAVKDFLRAMNEAR